MGFAPCVVHTDVHALSQVGERKCVRVKWVFCSGRHIDDLGLDGEIVGSDLTANSNLLRDGLVAIVDDDSNDGSHDRLLPSSSRRLPPTLRLEGKGYA